MHSSEAREGPPSWVDSDADTVLEAYYTDVRHSDLLDMATERALFKKYRTCSRCGHAYPLGSSANKCPKCATRRDYLSRDQLVQGALRFVLKVAKEYACLARGHRIDSELLKCLISAGNLGLLIAVDRFDLKKGTRFLTYAAWWIREKILEELDSMGVVRVPAYLQKAIRAKRKSNESATFDAGHVVMDDMSVIDKHYGDDRLERDLVNTYGTDVLHDALIALRLRGRDKYILLSYFGIREESKNLRQISSRLSLSSERVRQIKRDALIRLRNYLEGQQIGAARDVFTE